MDESEEFEDFDELGEFDELEEFLKSDIDENIDMSVTPEGDNLVSILDLKPRDMPQSIMAVYGKLGGDVWLLKQAEKNPKEFLSMLKSILPKNTNIDPDQVINILIAPASGKTSEEGIGVINLPKKVDSTNNLTEITG